MRGFGRLSLLPLLIACHAQVGRALAELGEHRLHVIAPAAAEVGRLSAIGTAGAITGTLLTGFVLLGLVPSRILIVGVGGLLVMIGLVVLAWIWFRIIKPRRAARPA